MAYKQVDERFWKDKKIKQLSKDAYLLFLYLLTSPHTHFSGLSEMSLNYANVDTPLTERESKAAYVELCNIGLIQYDSTHEIIWIRNMHKYQVKSEKQLRGAEKQINNLPRSALCKNLAEILKIPYPYPIDTLLIGYHPVISKDGYPIGHGFSPADTHGIKAEAKAEEEVKEKAEEEEEAKIYPSPGKAINIHAELLKALDKIIVSPKEIMIAEKLIEAGCIFEDIAVARKEKGKNQLAYLQNIVCEMRDKRIKKQEDETDYDSLPV